MSNEELRATACATCGSTFGDALDADRSGEWTIHWGSATSTTIEAETCGGACADAYERSMGR